MKKIAVLLAVVMLLPLLGIVGIVAALGGTTDPCAPAEGPSPGPGGADLSSLRADQIANAKAVISAGKADSITPWGIIIGLGVSYGESTWINVDHGDAAGPDSRGLFQQRSSWGPLAQRMDPYQASLLFYNRLKTIDYNSMSLTQAGHAVQINADPDYYTPFQSIAEAFYTKYGGSVAAGPVPSPSGSSTPSPGLCGDGTAVPPSEQAALAVKYALTKLGSPYIWGTAGPDTFDCSGLVQWAYAQVGVSLPHWSVAQWTAGPHPSSDQPAPGDIAVFSHDSTPYGIHHVGLVIDGTNMVEAPHTGAVVRISSWHRSELLGLVRPTAAPAV